MMWLGTFGFALAVAYMPGWSGASTSLRWLVASIACLAIVPFRPARFTWAHLFGLAFVAWSLLTYAWSDARLDYYGGLGRLAVGTCLFVLGSRLHDLSAFYKGAALGLAVSGVVALVADSGFFVFSQRGAGLFVNPLMFAEAAALIAAALLATPGGLHWQWCFAPLMMVGHGKGAVIAFCVAFAAWWGRGGIAVACAIAFVASGLLFGLAVLGLLPTVDVRLWLWRDTLSGASFFGHGLGSFETMFPLYAEYSTPNEHHAHSMYFETAFESGYVGAALLAAFLSSLLIDTERTAEKLLLIAFTMEGFYAFPDQMPFTFVAAALAAGHLARGVPCVGNRYLLGGTPRGPVLVPPGADHRAAP